MASLVVTSQQTKTAVLSQQSNTLGTATQSRSTVGLSKIQPSTITDLHKTVTVLNPATDLHGTKKHDKTKMKADTD